MPPTGVGQSGVVNKDLQLDRQACADCVDSLSILAEQ